MKTTKNVSLRARVLWRGLVFALNQVIFNMKMIGTDVSSAVTPAVLLLPEPDSLDHDKDRRGIYFHIAGRAGQTVTVQAQPNALFRGERLVATDSSERPGMGSMIQGVFVGNKPQTATFQNALLTLFFNENALSPDLAFDVCDPNLFITFQILFLVDCAWSATLWGTVPDVT